MLDVVIRGGEVVDGTGTRRVRADVGIKGDRIVKVGDVTEPAVRTIDATGKLVTPGFVDVHTHFDAQVFWDSALTPSPLHGVTTALAGNCGFTIAPLSDDPDDGDYLMRMLARVEGMPIETLRAGVPWDWTTTAEYFDRVQGDVGINLGFMVGHSAIRRIAMGPDASSRAATPDELERMKTLLRTGLEAGGLGFSTSYARTHNDADGHMVPSRYAEPRELVELAGVTGEFEGTGLEIIPQVGPTFDRWAVDLMTDMSVAARRPVNWNVMAVNAANLDQCHEKLAAGDEARAKGGKVVALTIPISFGVRLSFASGFVLDAMPDWEGPMLASRDEKMRMFRDKAARDALNAKAQSPDNPLRMMANWGNKIIFDVVAPENQQYRGRTVGEIAD
ncbi:MAG TPA: amidohydrolase family protein, partial [Acidimicrobiia bacterium]|nr:amidohydrolase family protein [Acidimicrobiia bacterium]